MVERLEVGAGDHLGMIRDDPRVPEGGSGYSPAYQPFHRFLQVLCPGPLLEVLVDLVVRLMAPRGSCQSRVVRPRRVAEHVLERLPLLVVGNGQREPLLRVVAGVDALGGGVSAAVALPR